MCPARAADLRIGTQKAACRNGRRKLRILALDSATSSCSAALWSDGTVLAERFAFMERGQSEALMPMIRTVLAEGDLRFDDLDLIAATVGPGAFTGLRICLATARALALAAHLPVVGVTTFEVVAVAQDPINMPLLVAIDSKRTDCYIQLFDKNLAALGEPKAVLPAAVAAMLPSGGVALAGTAADEVAIALAASGFEANRLRGHDFPHAVQVARLAAKRADRTMPRYGEAPPEPLYLRPPDVTVTKRKVRTAR